MELLVQLLAPWIAAHPRALAYFTVVVSIWFALGAAWQAIPSATRDGWERKYPRQIGFIRMLVELISNVVKAYQIGKFQVAQGKVRPNIAQAEPSAEAKS